MAATGRTDGDADSHGDRAVSAGRCGYCEGAGYLMRVKPGRVGRLAGSLVKCNVCEGSGRVRSGEAVRTILGLVQEGSE